MYRILIAAACVAVLSTTPLEGSEIKNMKCSKLEPRGNSSDPARKVYVEWARCENEEVVCYVYVMNMSISCKWKKQEE